MLAKRAARLDAVVILISHPKTLAGVFTQPTASPS